MRFLPSIVFISFVFALLGVAEAMPTIRISKTVESVEKGKSFQIRLAISTNESLKEIVISPIKPEGFDICAMPLPMIETKDDCVLIKQLEPGSTLTVIFRVSSPPLIDKPFKGVSTRETKLFDFNVSYKHLVGNTLRTESQTVSTSVRYTTSMYLYLLYGMIGIVLGHIVKLTTGEQEELVRLTSDQPKISKVVLLFRHIFVSRAVSLLTLLVIGFSVLLILAKDQMPIKGWYDSLALGIGLAILGDDKLLLKLKGSSPLTAKR